MATPNPRPTFPPAPIQAAPRKPGGIMGQRPRFPRRAAAWLIDFVILTGIRAVICLIAWAILYFVEKDQTEQARTLTRFIVGGVTLLVLFVVGWLYYALPEASARQATYGKRKKGLQVEDICGGPPSLLQTTVRYTLRVFSAIPLGIGFLLPLVMKRRQAMHDIGANCVVTVHEQEETSHASPANAAH